jgi:hypothetical protein
MPKSVVITMPGTLAVMFLSVEILVWVSVRVNSIKQSTACIFSRKPKGKADIQHESWRNLHDLARDLAPRGQKNRQRQERASQKRERACPSRNPGQIVLIPSLSSIFVFVLEKVESISTAQLMASWYAP